jgi:glycosyltransferase involved in cell wall biosynthesis
MKPLRIAIDARPLSERFTSNRTYWLELVRELVLMSAAENIELVLIGMQPIPPTTLPPVGNVREIVAPAVHSRIWSLFTFPKVCAREGVHVAHVQYTISPRLLIPTVTTIHDVSFFIEPQWFSWKDRTLLRLSVPSTAKRAARVIAVSENSRSEIVEMLHLEPEKVVSTPLGVPSTCRLVPLSEGHAYARDTLGLSEPYVLFVGGLQVRKNWRTAIEAVALARSKGAADLQLVITGRVRVDRKDLEETIHVAGGKEWVHLVGGIPETELALLYGGALAVIHPSLHEGFGLTPLEAFACGAPVIASNRGAIPEVVGNAAILLEPTDPSLWADAILSMREDAVRNKYVAMGLERASHFNWAKTAKQTIEVYRAAAAS